MMGWHPISLIFRNAVVLHGFTITCECTDVMRSGIYLSDPMIFAISNIEIAQAVEINRRKLTIRVTLAIYAAFFILPRKGIQIIASGKKHEFEIKPPGFIYAD